MTQKWLKSDFRGPTPKWLKSDSKWLKNDSKYVWSHFWVTLGSLWGLSARVTFESLLGRSNSFCASVELGGCPLHKPRRSGEPKRVVSKRVVLADVPRNENRSEGTFAKTTFWKPPFYLPMTLLVLKKGWFPKGWFRRMFPRNENRNEGTFAKTTLLRNRPFISQWEDLLYGFGCFWHS